MGMCLLILFCHWPFINSEDNGPCGLSDSIDLRPKYPTMLKTFYWMVLMTSCRVFLLLLISISTLEIVFRQLYKQECIPVGCVPSAAVAMSIPACTGQGGVSQNALGREGCVYSSMHLACGVCIPACTGQGGVCPWGCLPIGCVSQHALGQTHPPWTEWQTGVKTLPCGWSKYVFLFKVSFWN